MRIFVFRSGSEYICQWPRGIAERSLHDISPLGNTEPYSSDGQSVVGNEMLSRCTTVTKADRWSNDSCMGIGVVHVPEPK